MPTEVTKWSCDICGKLYEDEELAAGCEAYGAEEKPAWLKVGVSLYAFGEQGIEGPVEAVYFLPGHSIGVAITPRVHVSHNLSPRDDQFPVQIFDPMRGWDFARYVDRKQSEQHFENTARWWIQVCRAYGIEPDPSRATWSDSRRGRELAARIREIVDESSFGG